jgi:hypothetical protein
MKVTCYFWKSIFLSYLPSIDLVKLGESHMPLLRNIFFDCLTNIYWLKFDEDHNIWPKTDNTLRGHSKVLMSTPPIYQDTYSRFNESHMLFLRSIFISYLASIHSLVKLDESQMLCISCKDECLGGKICVERNDPLVFLMKITCYVSIAFSIRYLDIKCLSFATG